MLKNCRFTQLFLSDILALKFDISFTQLRGVFIMEKKLTFNLSYKNALILFVLVMFARSTSFVMIKIGLRSMGTFTLMSYRFFLASLFLFPILCNKRRSINKGILSKGMLLGILFFVVLAFEFTALKYSPASIVAILQNIAIVLIPLLEVIIFRKSFKKHVFVSVMIAFVGVAFVSFKAGYFSLSKGEILSLMTGIIFAFAIIFTDRVSKNDDPLLIGIIQVFTMAGMSIIATILFDTLSIPTTRVEILVIIGLAIVCTGFGFTLQPLAQSKIDSDLAGLMISFNPFFASILSISLLGEKLSFLTLVGIVLIIISLVFKYHCEKKDVVNKKVSSVTSKCRSYKVGS
jgi:drug/metabolite transporter (DMT)-like permease